jgi:hypothetical protein
MGKIYVLTKEAKRRQPCLRNESLPHFYMSDYSVLGILVREFEEAGVEVFFDDATRMQDLFWGIQEI